MKIKYIISIFTISILGLFILNDSYLRAEDTSIINMVDLNNIYKNIEDEINNNIDKEKIEEKYNCRLIEIDDINLKAQVAEAISEGKVIIDYYNNDKIAGKIVFKGLSDNYQILSTNLRRNNKILLLGILLTGYLLIYFLYKRLIKPFKRLEGFASNIAKGNLDIPLKIDKENYFGAFTEGFDIMREELLKAREGEYKANKSKKELVASLSHDIKTPVSTIEAICEVLEIKVDDQDILNKIKIVNSKAKIIDNLISNMFHATLEELQCLNIDVKEEPSIIIIDMLNELNLNNKIYLKNSIPTCLIYADKLRLNQVLDNIINNSYKYADTDIEVYFKEESKGISITILDKGPGVKEIELPLLTEKFYRGDNSKGKNGSGLGLFLSKTFIDGMGGDIQFYNDNGFCVIIYLKKV